MRYIVFSLLLVFSGCAAVSWAPTPGKPFQYVPLPLSAHIGGSATVEARFDLAPETAQHWARSGFGPTVVQRYQDEVARALIQDMSHGNLFSSILPANASAPDHQVTVHSRTYLAGNMVRLDLALKSVAGSPGVIEGTATGSCDLGPLNGPQADLAIVLPNFMRALKSDLASAVEQSRKEEADRREMERIRSSSLVDLLVSSEKDPTLARERNRALVAARSGLPQLLRSSRSNELSALVVKIEQTILDLSHEGEIAKDKAQQSVEAEPARQETPSGYLGVTMGPSVLGNGVPITSVAAGSPAQKAGLQVADIILTVDGAAITRPDLVAQRVGRSQPGTPLRFVIRRGGASHVFDIVVSKPKPPANTVEHFRDLAISYRERIELLKPVLAALKEEIANRNR